MQTIQTTINEKTGTEKRIIKGKNGFFVQWKHTNGQRELSEPMETLAEAKIALCYEGKEEAEA